MSKKAEKATWHEVTFSDSSSTRDAYLTSGKFALASGNGGVATLARVSEVAR